MVLEQLNSPTIQIFPREDGTIPIWDHPNFKSRVTLPDDYFAITRAEQGLEMIHQGRLNDEALMIMKVIGDAYCLNENQLRRYMLKKMSFSQTSKYLKRLRKYGFVERHKCRLAFIEEDGEETVKPPAPFTLGIGGYKLMSHLYPEFHFIQPDYWIEQPLAIQRYVAMNEVRCLMMEAGVLRKWKWNPYIGGSPKYKRPMAVGQLETSQGTIQFLLERPQMSQNFVGYLKTKFEEYRFLFERDRHFKLDSFSPADYQIVALYVSSVSMANYIREEVRPFNLPFDVWVFIDEWIDEERGLATAGALMNQDQLKRIQIDFLTKKKIESLT